MKICHDEMLWLYIGDERSVRMFWDAVREITGAGCACDYVQGG